MRPTLTAIIQKAKEESVSSSAEMTSKLLQDLRSLLNQDRSIPRGEWFKFVNELRVAKPGMATYWSISKWIEMIAADASNQRWNDRIGEYVDQTMVDEVDAANQIADKFFEAYDSVTNILTMSLSSTVTAALFRLKLENELHVIICESLPMGEGRTAAARLKKHGIEVKVIPDAMMGSVVEEIDICLVGADAITPHGVVNKVGTRAMAATCMTAGKPFVVLCSELKIVNMELVQFPRTKKDVDGVSGLEQIFEYTPLDLVDDIVTNRRIVPPSSLSWK